MNFFYDEGLKTADGSLTYEILRDPMVPFGLEKLGISEAMKETSVDVALGVQSRTIFSKIAGRGHVYHRGWRNQHTAAWVGPPHIKSLKDLQEKRVGISDFNSILCKLQIPKNECTTLLATRQQAWKRCRFH